MSCLYKLLMSLLSTRVSTIAIENELMSPNQKAPVHMKVAMNTHLLSSPSSLMRNATKKTALSRG